MTISYKLEQLTTDTLDIVRREKNMTAAIAIVDNRHTTEPEMILSTTGDDVSLIYIAAKALSEVLSQREINTKKLLHIVDKVIVSINNEGDDNE